MRRESKQTNQRLTIFVPDGAVTGRVIRFLETGLVAQVDRQVPRDAFFRFTLHLQQGVIAGEIASIGQEDNTCRLQFTALTSADQARLEPLIEPEDG
ncbi:MAG TPA: hypothetical protein VK689_15920 [Armatimonadota bacterium]|nr:hypothetical protein [Armatimonadota bacterium]